MSKFSVKKPLTVLVAVVVVLVLGFVSYTRMTPDLLPSMDFPYVIVTTTYIGASPEEVEAEVTKPLEQAMATLDNIETVSSSSAENYSMIMMQFTEDVNMDSVTVDILQKINAISGSWDDMVGTPSIIKINPNMLPVMIAAVGYDGMDIMELSDFVNDTVLPKLEGTTGIASVSASGVLEEEVQVVLNQEKIDALNQRVARLVGEQLDETEADLRDNKNELQSNLDKLTDGKGALDTGKDALGSVADLYASLNAQQAEVISNKTALNSQITNIQMIKGMLQGIVDTVKGVSVTIEMVAELDENIVELVETLELLVGMRQQAEDAGLAQQAAEIQQQIDAILGGLPITAEQVIADGRTYIAAVEQLNGMEIDINLTDFSTVGEMVAGLEQFIGTLDASVFEMQGFITQLETASKTITQALAEIDKKKTEGIIQMTEGAATMLVGETTLSTLLAQLDSGLEQLEDAREAAIKQSDITKVITMEMVSNILSAQNFSMPAGSVSQGNESLMVTVGNTIGSLDELQGLLLFDMGIDGLDPIYLTDVADVYVTDNAGEIYANINGNAGIMFTFNKQSNFSTAGASDNLLATFEAMELQYEGLHFTSLMNQGDYIYVVVRSVIQNLLMGALLAAIILILFLRDLRPTIITLVSIPVSVVFAFVLMYFAGVTLNMLSLAGLAVAVGMLVDNSVVVIENIYRLRAKGYSAIQAAVSGAGQVAGAIASSTLTTIAIFIPIVFVEGLTKQLFTDFALTFAFALLASLVIALTVVPSMASRMLKTVKQSNHKLMNPMLQAYEKLLKWVLRFKLPVLAGALALLILSGVLVLSRGFTFMPSMDMGSLTVSVTMPEEADFETAAHTADQIVEQIGTVDGVDTVGAMMGGSSLSIMGFGGGSGGGSTNVTMYVLLDENTRRSSDAIGADITEATQHLDAEISVSSSSGMDISMLSGNGVSVRLYGEDLDDLRAAASGLGAVLEGIEGVEEISGAVRETSPALRVVVDKNKAMAEGLTVAQIFMELSSALNTETTATTLSYSGESYSVVIDKGMDDELTPGYVRNYSFTVTGKDGEDKTVYLRDIADIQDTETLDSISRSENRRYLSVTATIADDYNVTLVAGNIQSAIEGYTLPTGIVYELSGESETIMESMSELLNMMLLGIALVYLIMVAQFQSLKSPFIVMFTIPLAFTGGLLALFFTGFEMSVISMIGFVMLVGIIVNNGIVLVDYINQLRAEGMDTRHAIIEAAITRVRPILMTSFTTVFGLLTMAFGVGEGAAMMQPIAIVCIGGLVYATILTLFVVPAMYELLNRKAMKVIDDAELEIVED